MSFIRNEFANHITKAGRVISKKSIYQQWRVSYDNNADIKVR